MAHFDERSGVVACKTEWGRWWQTLEEVYIEISAGKEIRAKQVQCTIGTNSLNVVIDGQVVINGDLFKAVHPDDSTWTLEDKKTILICLSKALNTADHCWKALLTDQFQADFLTFDEMEKKLTLQRFQAENPGFDFSGATMSGNYHGGGPQFPS